MYDNLKCKTLFNLDETIAKDIFNDVTFPWEVLPKIKDFIIELGKTLSLEEYSHPQEDIWIAKSATVAANASINGPCIIGKRRKYVRVLLSVAMRLWENTVLSEIQQN